MKKALFYLIVVGLMSSLLVTACAEPAPEPELVEPVEMKMATHMAPTQYANVFFEKEWFERIHEATGGRVKITLYPGQALGKLFDQWDMVKTGISNIGWITPSFFAGVFPLSNIGEMPYVNPSNCDLSVVKGLYDKYLYKEWTDVKVMWVGYIGPNQIHTRDKIATLEDFAGKQIRAPGGPLSSILEALGATPVSMSSAEVYSALERGIVDGCTYPLAGFRGAKLEEVTNYTTMCSVSNGICATVMNIDTWNSLPDDVKKAIDKVNSEWAENAWNEAVLVDQAASIEVIKNQGNTIVELTPAELERWFQATEHVRGDWAAEIDAMGLPGTEILEEALRLAALAKK